MASVLGMLEERETAARVRVEGLRRKSPGWLRRWRPPRSLDRRVIAREELVEALATSAAETTAGTEAEEKAVLSLAPVPGSTVPPGRGGLPVTVLTPDYQCILGVLEQQRSMGHGPLRAKEIAVELGLDVTPVKVEGLRSKPGAWRSAGGSSWRRRGRSVSAGGPWPSQTPAHPRDHRPPDHRLAGGGQGLVVPAQTAGVHQPRERALGHPAPGQHHEPCHVVGALDDLQGQGEFVPAPADEGGARARASGGRRRRPGPMRGSRRASPAMRSRPRPGSGSRPTAAGGSSPRAVHPAPGTRPARAATAGRPPTPRPSCPTGTGAPGPDGLPRRRTRARGNRTTRRAS